MKRCVSITLLVVSLLLIFQILAFGSDTIENLPSLIKKIQPSVVFIVTYDEQEEFLQFGSGFFINDNGGIITNYHVIQGAASAAIKTSEGNVYPIHSIIALDEQSDLVCLSVDIPQKDVYPLTLSEKYPDIGESVIVYGSPLGLENTVSNGIVSAIRSFSDSEGIIQITAPISPGSSGSPVLNMKGEVIGVATMTFTEGQNLNFAIPSNKVARLDTERENIEPDCDVSFNWNLATEKHSIDEEYYKEALCLIKNEEYEEAMSILERIVNTDSSSLKALVYSQIGYCNDSMGNYKKAIEAYEQAINFNPDDATIYNNLGDAFEKLGLYDKAINAYKEAINIKPNYPLACNNLGQVYSELGLYDEAIELFKNAVQVFGAYVLAHHNLGIAYEEIGLYQEAIDSYKHAVDGWAIDPAEYTDSYINLGNLYYELDLYDEAKEAFKEAIRVNPDYYLSYLGLGFVYLELNFYDEAKDIFKEVIRLNPNLSDGYFGIGVVCLLESFFEDAIQPIQQAISIDPTNAIYHYVLGCIYIEIGDKSSALDEYRILKELDVEIANDLFDHIFE